MSRSSPVSAFAQIETARARDINSDLILFIVLVLSGILIINISEKSLFPAKIQKNV